TANPEGNDDIAFIVRDQSLKVANSIIAKGILLLPHGEPPPSYGRLKRLLPGHSISARSRPLARILLSAPKDVKMRRGIRKAAQGGRWVRDGHKRTLGRAIHQCQSTFRLSRAISASISSSVICKSL